MEETNSAVVRTMEDMGEIFTAPERRIFLKRMIHTIEEQLEKAWTLASVSSFETAMDKMDVDEEMCFYYEKAFSWRREAHKSFYYLVEQIFVFMCGEEAEPEIESFLSGFPDGIYLRGFVVGWCLGQLEQSLSTLYILTVERGFSMECTTLLLERPERLRPFYSAMMEMHRADPETNTFKALAEKAVELAFTSRAEDDAWLDVPRYDQKTGKWAVVCGGEKTEGNALETACAFAERKLSYPYHTLKQLDEPAMAENFEAVLQALYKEALTFTIQGLEEYYSPQERELLREVQHRLLEHDPSCLRFR